MRSKSELENAYAFCLNMATSHYENFPVASILLPKKLRRPIAAIYAFARSADDFADEGDLSQVERLARLNDYSVLLRQIETGEYTGDDPIFIALQNTIQLFSLPVQLLEDLLIAFRQDVVKYRYANFEEVLDYCHYSANPVGRLLLHLEGSPNQSQLEQSDAICTALQLINFYQDIEQDYLEKNRIYLPQDYFKEAGIDDSQLLAGDTQKLSVVLRPLYQYTLQLMQEGYQLGMTLTGLLGWEIRAMTLGGIEALSLLIRQSDHALLSRPRLSKSQHLMVLTNALSKHRYHALASKLLQEKHLHH